MKKSIVLVTLFIILVASRAYPETLFWDNFNEKLEVKMNNRLIFNFDDYFRPPRLNLNDGSYTMMQMEALKEIEDIIGEDIEGSLLFALEKEWRQKREKSPKIRGLSKIGINKKTREIELRIENLKEELRDIKESGRTKDIKRAWELKNQIREKQKRLAEEKLIELGIDTSFDIRKFSEWNVSVAPFFEKSFGPVINKASFVYNSRPDAKKIKLETIVLFPKNTNLLVNNIKDLTENYWKTEITLEKWLNENTFLVLGHNYFWEEQANQDFISLIFIISDKIRINIDGKYDWEKQEHLDQLMLKFDF